MTNPFFYFMNPWNLPLSGAVAPVTSWFSPQYEINIAGDKDIEQQVITKVASYGKQLGKLTDAVLELADGEPGQAVEALRTLSDDIDRVKSKLLAASIEADLARLKKQDKAAYEALLQRL